MRTYSVRGRCSGGPTHRKETVGRAAADGGGVVSVVVVACPGNSILPSLLAKNDSCSMSRTPLLLHPRPPDRPVGSPSSPPLFLLRRRFTLCVRPQPYAVRASHPLAPCGVVRRRRSGNMRRRDN